VAQGKDRIKKAMNQVPVMKGWKSYLLWEGLPFVLLIGMFGFISVINWGYESKLTTLDNTASEWTGVHLGPLLLGIAIIHACIASVLLFVVRLVIRVTYPTLSSGWFMFVPLVLITIFFIFPSLFIVILGPAAITMQEQMSTTPK